MWDADAAHVLGLFERTSARRSPLCGAAARRSCRRSTCSSWRPHHLFDALLPRAGLLRDAPLAPGATTPTRRSSSPSKGLSILFVFCLVWSVGGALDDESRAPLRRVCAREGRPRRRHPAHDRPRARLALAPTGRRQGGDAPRARRRRRKAARPVVRRRGGASSTPPGPVFTPWLSLVPPFSYDPSTPFFEILVPTVDTVRSAFLLTANLEAGRPTLLCGASGVGKSVLTQRVLGELSKGSLWLSAQLNFSARTSASATQAMIEERLDKRRRTVLGPAPGKRLALFCDDVNMPMLETYGAAPPVELLRLLLDRGGLYDRGKPFWKEVQDVTLVSACGPPGGGRNPLTPRFVRHHHLVACRSRRAPAAHDPRGIFGGFVEGASGEVRECVKPLVERPSLCTTRSRDAAPDPAKPHYTFNLRDLSKVAQGVLRARRRAAAARPLLHLWWHEALRTLRPPRRRRRPRLAARDAAPLGVSTGRAAASRSRRRRSRRARSSTPPLDHLDDDRRRPRRPSRRVRGGARAPERLPPLLPPTSTSTRRRSARWPSSSSPTPSSTSAASAASSAPRAARRCSSASAARASSRSRASPPSCAARLREHRAAQGLRPGRLPRGPQGLYVGGGRGGAHTTFLFTDAHDRHEAFLEDIDSCSTRARCPDCSRRTSSTRSSTRCDEVARPAAGDARRACAALHLARARPPPPRARLLPRRRGLPLALPPVPLLINCTTIDWYDAWPEEALAAVASQVFERAAAEGEGGMQRGRGDARELGVLAGHVHASVREMAERFYVRAAAALVRDAALLPLKLLALYTSLLADQAARGGGRRWPGSRAASRKLKEARRRRRGMKVELSELQPVLEAKSIETSKLLVEVPARDTYRGPGEGARGARPQRRRQKPAAVR